MFPPFRFTKLKVPSTALPAVSILEINIKLTLFTLLIHFPGLIVHNSSEYVILEKNMPVFVLFPKNVRILFRWHYQSFSSHPLQPPGSILQVSPLFMIQSITDSSALYFFLSILCHSEIYQITRVKWVCQALSSPPNLFQQFQAYNWAAKFIS